MKGQTDVDLDINVSYSWECPIQVFKELKNQARRDTALHFLGKQGLSIEEIAHRAGFSESSAFIRAFKGWTGVTPYSYRKGL